MISWISGLGMEKRKACPDFLLMQLGELWDLSVRHRPQEEEQDQRFGFELVGVQLPMHSQVEMSLTSVYPSIK